MKVERIFTLGLVNYGIFFFFDSLCQRSSPTHMFRCFFSLSITIDNMTGYMNRYICAHSIFIVIVNIDIFYALERIFLGKKNIVPYWEGAMGEERTARIGHGDLNITWGSYNHIHSFSLKLNLMVTRLGKGGGGLHTNNI
jgi:hypothetical protein